MLVSDGVAARFYAGTSPTSAGNAISAAAGLAMIEVLIDEDLVANSARMGHYLTESVAALDDPFVGDIRFSGLLGGVELVADRDTQEPLSSELMGVIRDALFDDGMLLTVSGPLRNTLRLQPPLSVQKHHIDAFITALRRAFEVARQTATPDLRSAGK